MELADWVEAESAIRAIREAVFVSEQAVLKEWYGRAVGHARLQTLLDLATRQGLSRVTLAAQTQALGFSGFHMAGEPFMDAGIPLRSMVRDLLLPPSGPERR